jgi:isoamylase/glycogen operon protein
MVSQGVPMLLMGDEYGHTNHGNNNTWCHDDALNWFLWEELNANKDFWRFYRALIHFRLDHPELHRKKFLSTEVIDWHGEKPLQADWSGQSHFIAFTLKTDDRLKSLYVAFNANHDSAKVALPALGSLYRWYRVVDTSLAPPQDFCADSGAPVIESTFYNMPPYSAILLKAMPKRAA